MQATEAYIGGEERLAVTICEKGIQEMQDVLSRHLPSFSGMPIDVSVMQPTRRMRFRMHSCPLTSTWTNSGGSRKCRRG
jgi:hypothetical protein